MRFRGKERDGKAHSGTPTVCLLLLLCLSQMFGLLCLRLQSGTGKLCRRGTHGAWTREGAEPMERMTNRLPQRGGKPEERVEETAVGGNAREQRSGEGGWRGERE